MTLRTVLFSLILVFISEFAHAQNAPGADPRAILVERITMNGDEKNEWMDLFGIKANEIKVITQKPAYGARLRIEVWKPGDVQKPSYAETFEEWTFKEETTFTCTYRIYFTPSQFRSVAAPIAYPAMLSWHIIRGGKWEKDKWEKDNPPGFGGKGRIAIPNDCLGMPGYEVSPSADLYDNSKETELKSPLPLFHFFIANGGYTLEATPEKTRKAYPHYVHVIGWFEPLVKRNLFGVDHPEPEPVQPSDKSEKKETLLPNGTASPSWSLITTSGKTLGSADLLGKFSVLNFWATWCGPCMSEIPDFIALQAKYTPRRVQFVGLSIDKNMSAKQMARFLEWNFVENPINYPVTLAPDAVKASFGGIPAIPITYVVNPEGKIVFGHRGKLSRETLEQEIDRLLLAR